MRKNLNLFLGLVLIADLVYGFVKGNQTASFFGQEMNIWLHRALMSVLAASCLYSYYRAKKKEEGQ